MTARDSRQAAWRLLRPRLPATSVGHRAWSMFAGSALALAGASAWLITRAWRMPPVLDLSVAVVAVRALGISRGVLGYCERLVSHDVALRSAGHARSEIYRDSRADLCTPRVACAVASCWPWSGSDVDVLSDVLARALVPIGVALTVGIAAISVIAMISGAAATLLAVCLLFAGVVAPGWRRGPRGPRNRWRHGCVPGVTAQPSSRWITRQNFVWLAGWIRSSRKPNANNGIGAGRWTARRFRRPPPSRHRRQRRRSASWAR